jgi:TatD DNase family protein
MWIDTHCHLDAGEFGNESGALAAAAAQLGVAQIVIPAVACSNFEAVRALSAAHSGCSYALGIHPLFVPQAAPGDLELLRATVAASLNDPNFVAIGEIGLDFFVSELATGALRDKQEFFYREQLKLGRDFGLPVLLHVRRSQDIILKHLRRMTPPGGIAHAFNGSFQQAHEFIRLGFKLGFGGAMTFPRALQIRRLAAQLPEEALVLETDAPDMAPVWALSPRNSPEQLPRIGAVLAQLRNVPVERVAAFTSQNAVAAMPRLARAGCASMRIE